jgi:homoserine trans-succinylase
MVSSMQKEKYQMNGSRECSDNLFQGTSEKPFKGFIREWKKKYYADGFIITGIPIGHPSFQNWIYTSKVVSMKDSDGYWEVETLNSRYRLNYDEEYIASN